MPNPSDYDNQKDWMAACVPTRKDEHPDEGQDQSVAVCLSIWRKHTGEPEPKAVNALKTESFEQRQSRLWDAWRGQYVPRIDAEVVPESGYIEETFDTYIIVSVDGAYWKVGYTDKDGKFVFAPRDEWEKVKREQRWVHAKNALKTVATTADELRVANHIILFGGRDLEGVASPNVNADGSMGEYFTPETQLESAYTKAGTVFVDWEHRAAELGDELLGVVDWKTARVDDAGVFVERVLNRRSAYVRWLEGLIADGLIGTSSEAVSDEVEKAADGKIVRWPLRRDTLTVQPMEPRMLRENHIQAFKALGIELPALEHNEADDQGTAEAEPEGAKASASVARAKARCEQILLSLMEG